MRVLLSGLLLLLFMFPAAAFAGTIVEMETTKGVIVIELDDEKAPATTANFLRYAKEGFYSGTIFHRVIPNFMIQGGGITADMKEKKTYPPIKNEADNKLQNHKYTIAMARTADPNSATSQFFINTRDNNFLNYKNSTRDGWGYCVFGKVIEGFDVVDSIERVWTQTVGYFENVPVTPVVINNVTVR